MNLVISTHLCVIVNMSYATLYACIVIITHMIFDYYNN